MTVKSSFRSPPPPLPSKLEPKLTANSKQNAAIGLQPIDAKVIKYGFFPLEYPAIIGSGVAGTVVESKNPRFKPGDRVLSNTQFYGKNHNRYGAFQRFSIGGDLTIKV
jgi:hypothetical protein